MHFEVKAAAGTPVYLQIVGQIKRAVAEGRLRAGDRMPSVRELAVSLLVNPNTVHKAYRLLYSEKIVQSRKGTGMFVAEIVATIPGTAVRERAAEMTDSMIADLTLLGLSKGQITETVSERLKVFFRSEDRT